MEKEYKTILAIDKGGFVEFEKLSISLEEPSLRKVPSLGNGGYGSVDEARVQLGGTILWDQACAKYRMWYVAYPQFTGNLHWESHIAYAESKDGVNWVKPELGLVEFNGSRANNLVAGLPVSSDGISVIIDDDGFFKCTVMNTNVLTAEHLDDPRLQRECDCCPMPAFMGIAVSRDGVNWEFQTDGTPAIREKLEVCRLNKVNGRYIIAGQQMKPWCDCSDYARVVVFFESDDLNVWRKLPGFYRSESGFQCHVGIAPLIKVGETFLGLGGRFYDAPELPEQHYDIDLLVSRDGINWKMPNAAQPFLRRGGSGEWNSGGILQTQGMVNLGDEFLIYFSGNDIGNTFDARLIGGVACIKRHRFGYAALQVGWDIGFQGIRTGFLRTKLLEIYSANAEIKLNCDNFTKNGMLRLALTDQEGRIILPYSFDCCIPITSGGLNVPVCWQNITKLPITPFSIKIEFYGGVFRAESPRLYAIYIDDHITTIASSN